MERADRGTTGVVFWDFEGTLAYRPGKWSRCLHQCLVEVAGPAVALIEADIRRHLSGNFPWHEHDRHHHHLAEPDAWWASLEVVLRRALRLAGANSETAQAAARLMRYRFTDPRWWVVFPDTAASLETLRTAGWRNVIVSNHVPELERLVGDLGLAGLVDTVFSSALVGWEKPNPEFFRHALERTGRPARVWMVGDNPIADIEGARAVGIPALHVQPETTHGPGLRDAVDAIRKDRDAVDAIRKDREAVDAIRKDREAVDAIRESGDQLGHRQ
jgi:putative hydrolase of the HAD superfamily